MNDKFIVIYKIESTKYAIPPKLIEYNMNTSPNKFSLAQLSGLMTQLTIEEMGQKDRLPNLRRTVTFGTPEDGIHVTIGYPFSIKAKTLEQIWQRVDWFTLNFLHYKYTTNQEGKKIFHYICRQHQGTSNYTEEGDTIHPIKTKEDSSCPCEGSMYKGSLLIHSESIFEWTQKIVKAGKPVNCEEAITALQSQSIELESKDDLPLEDSKVRF